MSASHQGVEGYSGFKPGFGEFELNEDSDEPDADSQHGVRLYTCKPAW